MVAGRQEEPGSSEESEAEHSDGEGGAGGGDSGLSLEMNVRSPSLAASSHFSLPRIH